MWGLVGLQSSDRHELFRGRHRALDINKGDASDARAMVAQAT